MLNARYKTGSFAAALLLLMSAQAGSNPIFNMFPGRISFFVGFDEKTLEPSIGVTPTPSDKGCLFADDGLFGPGLAKGIVRFAQNGETPLADTKRPGTFVFWVKQIAEPKPIHRGMHDFEKGMFFMDVSGTSGKRLILMKSSDTDWGRGAIWFHYSGKKATGDRFASFVDTRCSTVGWKPGEWRMVAAAWTSDQLWVSVNGAPFVHRPYEVRMDSMLGDLYVRCGDFSKELRPCEFVVDEFAVLTDRLSDEEVKTLYEKTRQEAGL